MGIKTDIEWCDSTLNLQMGCDGCELWNPRAGIKRCYAGKITARQAGVKGWPAAFEQPMIFPERLQQALKWPDLTGKDRPGKPWLNGYPRVIFLNDMGDTFTENLDVFWLDPFIEPMRDSPHVYIISSKRPKRMAAYFWDRFSAGGSVPANFWLLTSITGPENVGRICELLKLRAFGARVLGVSHEPAWGPVDFRPYLPAEKVMVTRDGLDWIIAGGESGAGARPSNPDWFRAARDACRAAGAPFFFKQWGEYVGGSCDRKGWFYPNNLAPQWGRAGSNRMVYWGGWVASDLVGKKTAGATLDGREWRQMPERKRLEGSA